MASMEHICPLSTPPPADYARMRWPQQMRQPRPGDGWHPCPLRLTDGELHMLNDHEGPHGVSWLFYRRDTVRLVGDPPYKRKMLRVNDRYMGE